MTESSDPDQPGVLVNVAKLLAQKDAQKVVVPFFAKITSQPDNAKSNFVAAALASAIEDNNRFSWFIEKAIAAAPAWEAAALLKAESQSREKPDETIAFAEAFLSKTPGANRLRVHLARLLWQKEELDLALRHLNRVLDDHPESLDALFNKGLIQYEKKQLDEATDTLETLLDIAPQDDQTKFYLAQIAVEQENYQRAIVYLQQVSGQQRYLDAQIMIARTLVKLNGMDAGFEYLERIGTRSEADQVSLILEQESILREHKAKDRLQQLLNTSLERYPNQPDLLYSRALLSAEQGLVEQTERDLRIVIELQPDNAHAYNALGYTLADKTDRLDEALALIVKADKLLPDNPFILDSLGWVYFKKGDLEQAQTFLSTALELRQDPEIAAHLGEVLWLKGDQAKAKSIWNEARENHPDNSVLQETMERFLGAEHQSVNLPSHLFNHVSHLQNKVTLPIS